MRSLWSFRLPPLGNTAELDCGAESPGLQVLPLVGGPSCFNQRRTPKKWCGSAFSLSMTRKIGCGADPYILVLPLLVAGTFLQPGSLISEVVQLTTWA